MIPQGAVKKELTTISKAAESGDPQAQFKYAKQYELGEGVPQNMSKAIQWYRRAAEQGHVDSQFNLGLFYSEGRGVLQNCQESLKWFLKAAEKGDAGAQLELGFYYAGEMEWNPIVAKEWFRKSAEQGNADAQYELAKLCEDPSIPGSDMEEALEWYGRAAINLHPAALLKMGEAYADPSRSAEYAQISAKYFELYANRLRQLAEGGDKESQYKWAMLLINGQHVERNTSEGVSWLQKAVEQKQPDAMVTLAGLHMDGRGVPRDPAKAIDLLKQAAELGHDKAQARLEALRPQDE